MTNFITPEQAEKLLSADFRNVAKKVAEGKTLTAAERDLIKAKAAGCDDSSILAKNFEELAALLGVSVRTINRWRKLKGAPGPLPDGGLPLIEWRQFVRSRNLKAQPPQQVEALKARKMLAEIEDRELKVAIRKGEYILLSEVRREWTTQVGKAIALLRAKFENELPPILSGLEAQGIRGECAKAIDEVCHTLHAGGGMTP